MGDMIGNVGGVSIGLITRDRIGRYNWERIFIPIRNGTKLNFVPVYDCCGFLCWARSEKYVPRKKQK